MFGMVFHNPAAWVGLAAIGAPLLIHLLTRRTPKRIIFPTIRFIKKAEANLSSLFRLRHWLLLVVRTLLIMAVLFAFLRPAMNHGSIAVNDPKAQQRAAIIIVDGSMSMGYTRGGGGPMARARQAATKLIDSLGGNDRCNLIVAGGMPHATFDEPSNNRYQLRLDMQQLKPTLERADFDAAIAEALRQIGPLTGVRKEIHFVSDFQRGNWECVQLGRIPEAITTTFVSVAEANPQNLAITEVRAVPGNPVVDEPVSIVCKVANYGIQPVQTKLTAHIGDEPPIEHPLDLKPGMTVSTTFRIRARKTGFFEATLQLPPDDMPDDNFRHFVLPVADKIEVLVLTDEPAQDNASSHHFLIRALDPFAGGRGGTMHCVLRAPDAMTRFDLARAHLVVICGARELSLTSAKLLIEYLGQGGSLMQFVASEADKSTLNTLASLSNKEMVLPFEAGTRVDHAQHGSPAYLAKINYDDPMMRTFRDLPELRDIPFSRYFATRRDKEEGDVLATYSDGNIAVARQTVQLGTLLLCNFNPTPADGELVKRTLFVPLVHEMTGSLRPQAGVWRSCQIGAPCAATVTLDPKDPAPMLYSPAGEQLNAVVEKGKTDAMIIYPRAAERGFYRVKSGNKLMAAVPVNVDPRESNLDSLSAGQVKDLMGGARKQFLAANAGKGDELDRLTEGRIVWPWFLLAGMMLLGIEQFLTTIWRRLGA